VSEWSSALLLAFGFSFLTAGVFWIVGQFATDDEKTPDVGFWRTARIFTLVPFLVASFAMTMGSSLPRLDLPAFNLSSTNEPSSSVIEPEQSIIVEPPVLASSQVEEARNAAPTKPREIAEPLSSNSGLSIDWIWLFWASYALGLAVLLMRYGIQRLALHTLIAGSQPPPEWLIDVHHNWMVKLGLRPEKIRIRIVDAAISPFVTGWQPIVVLPKAMAEMKNNETAEMALVHELVHIKRNDERDRLVSEIIGLLFWFNPALGWIERRIAFAKEMACDAEVLGVLGKGRRRAYAGALIDAARVGPQPLPRASAFGPSHSRSKIMRIKAIMSSENERHSNSRRNFATAAILAAALIPTAAAQALVTASLQAEPIVIAAAVAAVQSDSTSTASAARRTVNASPLAALERLEMLETLENLEPESLLSNPANWMAIGAFASGASETLDVTGEDENGNPIRISLYEGDDGDRVNLEFVDETGRTNLIHVDETGGTDQISMRYEGEDEPYFSVNEAEDGNTHLRFLDMQNRPVSFEVDDSSGDNDVNLITITDEQSGASSRLRFDERDDGQMVAPAVGRISHVGNDTSGEDAIGQYVVIDHGTGWSTIFYALDSIVVTQGQDVAEGDVIGDGDDEHRILDNEFFEMEGGNISIVRTEDVII